MNLSFVIPCYRSEHTIIPVLEEIRNKMIEQPEITYEVNTVNDNSPDDVLSVLYDYADQHSFLNVIDLTRNFGQHAAMMAGLSQAKGDIVIFLDDDGQCPMDHLWELLAHRKTITMSPWHSISLKTGKSLSSGFSAAVLTTP